MKYFSIKYVRCQSIKNDRYSYVGVLSPYSEKPIIRISDTKNRNIFHSEDELPIVLRFLESNGFQTIVESVKK
jgi:hypothetical protein